MSKRIIGYILSIFALISWVAFGIIKYDAHVSYKVANQPHGPADLNGLAGLFGLGADIVASIVLIAAIFFSLIAIALLRKSKRRT